MNVFGKWRNICGVEIEVSGICAHDVIGTIYKGVIKDDRQGARAVLLTTQGLEEFGYQKVEDE